MIAVTLVVTIVTDLPSHEDEVSVFQFAVVEVISVELFRKLIVERQELPLQNSHHNRSHLVVQIPNYQ